MPDPQQPETAQTQPETARAGSFRKILDDMRAARTSFQQGNLGEQEYIRRIVQLEKSLDQKLKNRFNDSSGIEETAGEPDRGRQRPVLRTLSAEEEIIKTLQGKSDAPKGFYEPENETRSRNELLARLIANNPHLGKMTLADAVEVVQKTRDGETADWKYADTEPRIVMATALTMLNINRERLRTEHPQMFRDLEGSSPEYMHELVSERILGEVEQDEEFVAWEGEKRDTVIKAVRADKDLMADIARLRPLLDSTSERDLLAQHALRDSMTQRMGAIYARVYDTPELARGENIHSTYATIDQMLENDIIGQAGGVIGVKDEDYVFIRTTLYPELMLRNPHDTPQEIAESYLNVVNEEMRHAVDNIYGDRLVNGQMDPAHPAFRHTNLIVLNNFNYIPDGDAYRTQYLERTAKEAAAEISAVIAGEIYPQPATPTSTPQGQTVELPGMTITGNAKPR
jgi:hypothetical protein